MTKLEALLILITVKCGTQTASTKIEFSQSTTPEEIILKLEPQFQLSMYVAFSELWRIIALEQEMSGGVFHDIEVEFSLIINGNTEKPLHKLEIAKGTVAEIQRQLGDSLRLVTLLFYKATPILFESYTL